MQDKFNEVIISLLVASIAMPIIFYSDIVEAVDKDIIDIENVTTPIKERNAVNLIQNPTFERSIGNPIDNWNIYFGRYFLTGFDFPNVGGMSTQAAPHVNWYFSAGTNNLWIKKPDSSPFGVMSYTRDNIGTNTAVAQTISTIPGRQYNFNLKTEKVSSNILTMLSPNVYVAAFDGTAVSGANPLGITEAITVNENQPVYLALDFQAKTSLTTVILRSAYQNYGLDDYTGVTLTDPEMYEYGNDVEVRYVNQNGDNLADSKILTGFLDEPFITEALEFEDYVLVESPQNATGNFTREDQTVTYIYARQQGVPVLVEYMSIDGNQLADSIVLEGALGDPFAAEAKEIYGYTLVEMPSNTEGIFTNESQTVTFIYHVSGSLSFEFPETIEFKSAAIQTSGMILKRVESATGLRVIDSRVAEQQQNWVLTLSLIEDLASDKQQIQGALSYNNGTELVPLNAGTQEVYRSDSPIAEPIEIDWEEDEGLLAIIPGNKALPGVYAGKVLWSLVTGP